MWYNYLFYNNNLWYLWVMTNLNLICWQYIWWVLLKVFSIWLTFNNIFLKCRQHSSLNPIWSKTCMKDKTHRIIFPSTLFVVWLIFMNVMMQHHIYAINTSEEVPNVSTYLYEVWDSISSTGEQWPGREESPRCTHFLAHSTPRRLLSPVRVPVETCVENLLHGDACLLPVCRGGWAMSRLWVGLALQSTQKGISV